MNINPFGRTIFINLDTGKIDIEILDDQIYRKYIGGYGIGSYILYKLMSSGVDPFSPESFIGFTTGLLTGTLAPCSSRFTVVGKSPVTGMWADSNCGGSFGYEIRRAGIDNIFITGKANSPKYIYIKDDVIQLRSADDIWGLFTSESEKKLKQYFGDEKAKAITIGPAGEKGSLMSSIIHDFGRAAARAGLAAVMGKKMLKGIVIRGTGKVVPNNKDIINETRNNYLKYLKSLDKGPYKILSKWGTAGNLEVNVAVGECGVRNWQHFGIESFPKASKISGDNVTKYQYKKYACINCPIACGGFVRVTEGKYKVEKAHKPEYETLGSFGPMCNNDDIESIIYANELCNQYGADTISVGATVAFALECYEKGILNKQEVDGLELNWGNTDAIITLTEKILKRKGVGKLFADGVKSAAEQIGRGSEKYAIHVCGEEIAYHNPLVLPGWATTYVADPTPGRHTAGTSAVAEAGARKSPNSKLKIPKVERYEYDKKGIVHALWSNYHQTFVCSGLCLFPLNIGEYPLVEFIQGITGWNFNINEAVNSGKRIQTLRQCFNVREGLEPGSLKLPGRLVGNPPAIDGPVKGVQIDYNRLRKDYYHAMGWDESTGIPSYNTIKELELDNLVTKGDLRLK